MNLAETDLHVKVKRRPIVATFRVKREGYKEDIRLLTPPTAECGGLKASFVDSYRCVAGSSWPSFAGDVFGY